MKRPAFNSAQHDLLGVMMPGARQAQPVESPPASVPADAVAPSIDSVLPTRPADWRALLDRFAEGMFFEIIATSQWTQVVDERLDVSDEGMWNLFRHGSVARWDPTLSGFRERIVKRIVLMLPQQAADACSRLPLVATSSHLTTVFLRLAPRDAWHQRVVPPELTALIERGR